MKIHIVWVLLVLYFILIVSAGFYLGVPTTLAGGTFWFLGYLTGLSLTT